MEIDNMLADSGGETETWEPFVHDYGKGLSSYDPHGGYLARDPNEVKKYMVDDDYLHDPYEKSPWGPDAADVSGSQYHDWLTAGQSIPGYGRRIPKIQMSWPDAPDYYGPVPFRKLYGNADPSPNAFLDDEDFRSFNDPATRLGDIIGETGLTKQEWIDQGMKDTPPAGLMEALNETKAWKDRNHFMQPGPLEENEARGGSPRPLPYSPEYTAPERGGMTYDEYKKRDDLSPFIPGGIAGARKERYFPEGKGPPKPALPKPPPPEEEPPMVRRIIPPSVSLADASGGAGVGALAGLAGMTMPQRYDPGWEDDQKRLVPSWRSNEHGDQLDEEITEGELVKRFLNQKSVPSDEGEYEPIGPERIYHRVEDLIKKKVERETY
jgi:hypothetical protein